MKTYPVQGGGLVPEWLVREAYAEYERIFSTGQSFETIQERGGFGRDELLDLLAGGTGDGALLKRMRAGRELPPYVSRSKVLQLAMDFAGEATTAPGKREAMALLIVKAAGELCRQGFRHKDIEEATKALTKADLP